MTMEEDYKSTKGDEGCIVWLLVIGPGVAGTWVLYGPGLGLLSAPLWLLIALGVLRVFGSKKQGSKES